MSKMAVDHKNILNCLTEGKKYIEINIQILSGDVLFIICESVDWTEETFQETYSDIFLLG